MRREEDRDEAEYWKESVMSNRAITKTAALGAVVGFASLSVFELLLAAGAPLGEAAWGGETEGALPPGPRVGSAISLVAYAVAAAVVLRRAGLRVNWPSRRTARIGTWLLVVLMTVGTSANLLSQSPWERFLLAPVTLVLAGLCTVVAVGDTEGGLRPAPHDRRRPAQTRPSREVKQSR
jgi:hypothetical protein